MWSGKIIVYSCGIFGLTFGSRVMVSNKLWVQLQARKGSSRWLGAFVAAYEEDLGCRAVKS